MSKQHTFETKPQSC